jgi:hypothetical protein
MLPEDQHRSQDKHRHGRWLMFLCVPGQVLRSWSGRIRIIGEIAPSL